MAEKARKWVRPSCEERTGCFFNSKSMLIHVRESLAPELDVAEKRRCVEVGLVFGHPC